MVVYNMTTGLRQVIYYPAVPYFSGTGVGLVLMMLMPIGNRVNLSTQPHVNRLHATSLVLPELM